MFGFMKSPLKIYVLLGLWGGILLTACQPAPAEPAVEALPTLASIAVVPTTNSASAPLPTALFPTPTPAVVAESQAISASATPLPTAASVIVPTPVGFVPTATAVVLSLPTPRPQSSQSITSSGSGTFSGSYSGSLDLPPLPTIPPEQYEAFLEASLLWMDNLKTCNPVSITITIPFFNKPHTNTIIGQEGDVCVVKMENDMAIFECRFNQEAINTLTREELYEELRAGIIHASTSDPSSMVLNEQCAITILDYPQP